MRITAGCEEDAESLHMKINIHGTFADKNKARQLKKQYENETTECESNVFGGTKCSRMYWFEDEMKESCLHYREGLEYILRGILNEQATK